MKFIKANKGKTCCDNCRFYSMSMGAWKNRNEDINQSGGHCHVNPPILIDNGSGEWPYVNGDDWCGKFEPNK